jgi:hypothetical protein
MASALNTAGGPVTGADLKPGKWLIWLGPCASLLCMAHCLAMPTLLLMAPKAFGYLPYNGLHELEVLFWIFAVDMGTLTLRQSDVAQPAIYGFLAIALIAPFVFFLSHFHFYYVLAAMAVYQFVLVLFRHYQRRKQRPACCTHEH